MIPSITIIHTILSGKNTVVSQVTTTPILCTGYYKLFYTCVCVCACVCMRVCVCACVCVCVKLYTFGLSLLKTCEQYVSLWCDERELGTSNGPNY